MIVSVFADEINNDDPVRALALAREWGVSHVEIRSLPEGRFPRIPDGRLGEYGRQITDHGLAVSGVSPGFLKCPWDVVTVMGALAAGLPRACEWALRLGTDRVSEFTFRRAGATVPSEAIDLLGRASEVVAANGCRLAVENVSGCWGDTGQAAAGIIRRVDAERIGLCWDPGNSARSGGASPFGPEYEEVKDLIAQVHLKSFDPGSGQWALLDGGMVDWADRLAALEADGFDGFLVIETHQREAVLPEDGSGLSAGERNTRRNLELLWTWLDASGGPGAVVDQC